MMARCCYARERASLLELSPDNRVVRCAVRLTRLEIHVGDFAALRQRRRRQNVIDAPAKVTFKRVSKVVPIRVLHTIGMELSEDIDKPPGNGLFVSGSG